MLLPVLPLLSLLSLTGAPALALALALGIPPNLDVGFKHCETLVEAAHNARRLVHDITTGTMGSVFPSSADHAGYPFALMESVRNIVAAPHHAAAYTVTMPTDGVWSAMSRSRVAFIGNMTLLPDLSTKERKQLSKCYLSYHPDAKSWLPDAPDSPHISIWAKMDIEDIYYVGGFGDTHYIGHIPVDLYAQADKDMYDYTNTNTQADDDKQLAIQA